MLNIEVSWVWGWVGFVDVILQGTIPLIRLKPGHSAKKTKQGNSLKNMEDNDTFITNIKNYCDTLFRKTEIKLWQEPDQ